MYALLWLWCAGCAPAAETVGPPSESTTAITTADTTTATTAEVTTTTTTVTTTTATTVPTTRKPTTTAVTSTTTGKTTTTMTTTAATTTTTTTTTTAATTTATTVGDTADPTTVATTTTTTTLPVTTTTTVPLKIIRLYIDQGHNPHSFNTGAEGNGLREQDVTYAVGVALAKLLESDPRFEVRLSRPKADTLLGTNNTTSLKARTDDANQWGADYFISIHCNAHSTSSANGVEAFAYATGGNGFALGSRIVEALVRETGFRSRGMKVDPDLYVLRNTAMPAVLVEIGFITNTTEAALMASDPGRFAQGIYNGILTFFDD